MEEIGVWKTSMRSKNVRDSDTINIIFIETCEPSLLQKINKRHRNAN